MRRENASRSHIETLLKNKKSREALKRAAKRFSDFFKANANKFKQAVDDQQERLATAGFPIVGDDWLESLIYIADIADIEIEGLSADDIERKAHAFIDREKIRLALSEKGGKENNQKAEPMTKTALCQIFGVSRHKADELLAKYPHEKFGRKYRLRIADMPPKYRKIFAED